MSTNFDQEIHIGMMNEDAHGLDELYVLIDEIVSSNQTSTPVSQIGKSEAN